MQISLDDLTVNFEHADREALLVDWEWLIGPDRLPILITFIGNAYVQDAADGTIHELDASFGLLEQVAGSPDELRELLGDPGFVGERFTPRLCGDLRAAGMALAPGEVFSFKQPLALGGAAAVDNLEPTSLEVHFSLTGQLHRQIAELPEGTPIKSIRLE